MNLNTELLKTLGQIAGIGGIALGTFLILFREVIRKKIFPQLTKQQGYRIILVFLFLTWSVAIAGVIAWVMTKDDHKPSVSSTKISIVRANLWGVDLDTKGALIDTKTVFGKQDSNVDDSMLEQLVDWISLKLGVHKHEGHPQIQVKIEIPADLAEKSFVIKRVPEGPMDILLWDMTGGGKIRVPLNEAMVKDLQSDFYLEVRVPGFEIETLKIIWGQSLNKMLELKPSTVSIGIEQFDGNTLGIADRLSGILNTHGKFKVVSPSMLKTIREEISRHNERIRLNPMIQQSIRGLGVDYLVSGNVSVQLQDNE